MNERVEFESFNARLLLADAVSVATSHTAGQTATQTTKPAASAESQASIQTLEPGKPIERELAGGQTHAYQIIAKRPIPSRRGRAREHYSYCTVRREAGETG